MKNSMKANKVILEKKSQESGKHISDVLNLSIGNILILDSLGSVKSINYYTNNSLLDELIGVNWISLLDGEYQNVARAELTNAKSTDTKTSFEISVKSIKNEEVWYQVNFLPMQSSTKKEIALSVNDITVHKQTVYSLKRSEKFLRTVVDTEPECVKLVSKTGELLEMNKAGLAMLQVNTLSEANQMSLTDYINPEYRDGFINLHKLVMSGKSGKFEFQVTGKLGGKLWLETHATPLKDENNNVTMLLGITRDVTIQKNAELTARESQQLWKYALEGSGDGVWDWKIKEKKMIFSNRWKEILGYGANELLDNFDQWRKLVHAEDQSASFVNLINHADGVDEYVSEHRVLCKNNNYKWILARGKIVERASDGKPVRMVGTITDLTSFKQAEQQLIQSSKLISLGQLTAGMAHEINNPLSIIVGSLKSLSRKQGYDAKEIEWINKIQRSTERISKIVNGLRKYSRSSEDGDLKVHNLSRIVNEVLVLTNVNVKGNDVVIEYMAHQDTLILCDEIEIEQVLINIINNAVDAIKDNQEKWIRIELINKPDTVNLRIKDSGHGVPKDIQDKLFDPFFTTKQVGEGTGLGLSITKGLLEKNRGAIRLVEEDVNTCFEIVFEKIKN